MRAVILTALAVAGFGVLRADTWSSETHAVSGDGTVLLTCRARLAGDYLVIELRAADGWHVYAMDNQQRAKEALAGKMSLGVEQNTEVIVDTGLQVIGDWYQSEPEDFSQPALRWYSYGFSETSLLAAKVTRNGAEVALVRVRAQACDSDRCVSVEAKMELDLAGADDVQFQPLGLGLVRVQGG